MPAVPQECQALAAEVAALQATEQNLRAQLTTLVGSEAWAALAKLGQTRLQLSQKQADLDTCVHDHSAALQANLVIMDLAPDGGPQPSRVGNLWEIATTGTALRQTSAVSANVFSFAGPLPAQLGISVVTTGVADVTGPDFRSAPIPSDVAPGPVRVEVVLLPPVRIEAADLSGLVASAFTPVSQQIPAGSLSTDVSVLAADAVLTTDGIIGRVNGQVEIHTPAGSTGKVAFSGTATLSLVPSATPASSDLIDRINVTDLTVNAPGIIGAIASLVLPVIRDNLSGRITDLARQVLRSALPAAIARSLVLPALPAGVVLSVRRIGIDSTAITFQATLGAIGTTLSAFHAPAISPP